MGRAVCVLPPAAAIRTSSFHERFLAPFFLEEVNMAHPGPARWSCRPLLRAAPPSRRGTLAPAAVFLGDGRLLSAPLRALEKKTVVLKYSINGLPASLVQ